MAAMHYCELDADPSLGIRNRAPRGRSETWQEGEIARLAKEAWRSGYRGLAALLAIAWDTQFSPVDCRLLTPDQRLQDRRGVFFDTSRAKTRRATIGMLSRRSGRLLDAYLTRLEMQLHSDAPIIRNRSGRPYSKDTLGDDFRVVRQRVFPGDTRRLMDIRRSGAVEAIAGDVDPAALGQKMATASMNQERSSRHIYRVGPPQSGWPMRHASAVEESCGRTNGEQKDGNFPSNAGFRDGAIHQKWRKNWRE